MKNRILGLSVFIYMVLFTSTQLWATVDTYMNYMYPYNEIQSDEICLDTAKMHAVIGIPAISVLKGVFNPVLVYHQELEDYENINILGKMISIKSINEEILTNKVIYTIELDFAELSNHNGLTIDGRRETINTAKLAVIAVVENLSQMTYWLPHQAFVKMYNLPSQTGLKGKTVYSTTMYPYSQYSLLYLNYKSELIGNNCE